MDIKIENVGGEKTHDNQQSHVKALRNINQMGCNCCRMLDSYMFKPEEPQTNGYVNEAHNYEHDRSSSPTIKISELKNEGHGVIEQDRFAGAYDLYTVPEKINAKADEIDSSEPIHLSSNAILNMNFSGEIKEDGQTSQYNGNLQTMILSDQHGLDQNSNIKHNSDEPECVQHEFSESIQENNSLTESAILDVLSGKLISEMPSDINGLSGEEMLALDGNTDPPDKNHHGYNSSPEYKVGISRSREPSLVALMIERSSARNSQKSVIITNGVFPEDEMDPDVAEALAALAAAIAGEDYEDS